MRLLIALAAGVLLLAALPAAAEPIGRVKTATGQAFLVNAGARVPARPGDAVATATVLETGGDGTLGVTFTDETKLSLGPNTSVEMANYAFAPASEEYGFLARMSRGTALFVSGLLGKLSPSSVSVETPSGTIGIRGTRFLVRVTPDV